MFGQARQASICKSSNKDNLRERRCKQEKYEALNVVQKFVNGEEQNKVNIL